jgi:myo-inositol-1(or 4)-monophosphatase
MREPSSELSTMIAAAERAGAGLMRWFRERSHLTIELKGPADYVSTADLESEQTLKSILLGAHPRRGFVGEESAPGGESRTAHQERYIVDPLDGTTNFLRGVPHFAVSIALESAGRLVAGVVFDPAKNEMFVAEHGCGAWLAAAPASVSADVDLSTALVGTGIPHSNARHRHASYLELLRRAMHDAAGIRRLGSAALDLAYVAAGRFGVYFEFGLSPWDIAAGVVLVQEAGGRVTEPGGGDRFLASGDVVATNGRLHPRMIALLDPAPGPGGGQP